MITCGWCITSLRPGSDCVLHSRRIYFNVLSSFKSRRLNQLETVNWFWISSAVLHSWLSRDNGCEPGVDSDAELHMSRTKCINFCNVVNRNARWILMLIQCDLSNRLFWAKVLEVLRAEMTQKVFHYSIHCTAEVNREFTPLCVRHVSTVTVQTDMFVQ